MKLYHTDSQGTKKLIADDIPNPKAAMEFLMTDSKTRFTLPKGRIGIVANSTKHLRFTAGAGEFTGYSLEEN